MRQKRVTPQEGRRFSGLVTHRSPLVGVTTRVAIASDDKSSFPIGMLPVMSPNSSAKGKRARQVLPSVEDATAAGHTGRRSSHANTPSARTPQDVNVYVSPLEGDMPQSRPHNSARPHSAHPGSGSGGRCVGMNRMTAVCLLTLMTPL